MSSGGHGELLAILRLGSFREYAVSRGANGLATGLLQALILWQVYAISGSALSLGIVGLVAFVAALVSSLIGGALVDSYDRRTILLVSQLVPGLGSLAMLAAIASNAVSLPLIYGFVMITGIAASLEFPARQAILPAVVPRHLFARALTVNSATSSLTSVTGPAIGGVLIAIGGVGAAYTAHVVLVAIAMLSLAPLHVHARGGGGRLDMGAVREGVAYVWHRPILLGAMTLDMFAVLFGGARALLPVYAVDVLRGRVTGVSSIFISASNELGALESGLVAAATGAVFAVVSGGLACLVVVALIAWRVPSLRRYSRSA